MTPSYLPAGAASFRLTVAMWNNCAVSNTSAQRQASIASMAIDTNMRRSATGSSPDGRHRQPVDRAKDLKSQQREADREARLTISAELGHEREGITAVYLGR